MGGVFMNELSPDIQHTYLEGKNGPLVVVRDDLLPGGTKQRACAPYLTQMAQLGHKEFIYASPFSGYAQVALSYVCQKLKLKCTLVCETQSESRFHPYSLLSQQYGARLIKASDLTSAEARAQELVLNESILKIPLGFDSDDFRFHLKEEIHLKWKKFESTLNTKVKNLWLPLGSGTLAKTFSEILPNHITINCVNVHVLKNKDQRIQKLKKNSRINIYEAPMKFHERANMIPAIPSNEFYDAKLWSFINQYGQAGDVWWNVAK
jgi:hypothetical protein